MGSENHDASVEVHYLGDDTCLRCSCGETIMMYYSSMSLRDLRSEEIAHKMSKLKLGNVLPKVDETPIPEELCGAAEAGGPRVGERCVFLPHDWATPHSWMPPVD